MAETELFLRGLPHFWQNDAKSTFLALQFLFEQLMNPNFFFFFWLEDEAELDPEEEL